MGTLSFLQAVDEKQENTNKITLFKGKAMGFEAPENK